MRVRYHQKNRPQPGVEPGIGGTANVGHTTTSIRSDAISSVSRIISAAKRAFAVGDGSRSLTGIAKDAGVGVATLYRHFPSRQALAHAVYEDIFATEIEPLLAAFGESTTPRSVLLDIAERLADVALEEHGMVSSMGNMAEVTTEFLSRSTATLTPAVARAQAAGNLRADLEPGDIPNLLAMVTIGLGAVSRDKSTRRRYLSLMLDALNPAQATPLPR